MMHELKSQSKKKKAWRRAAIVVLAAVMMAVTAGMVAFGVDVGYLLLARTELQRAADASALAAAGELSDQLLSASQRTANARLTAAAFASKNHVCSLAPTVDVDNDVVIGTIETLGIRNPQMVFQDPQRFNAVEVLVRRSSAQNGEVPLFFGNVFGIASVSLHAEATAVVVTSVKGFRIPNTNTPESFTVPLLPITLHETVWDALGTTQSDEWEWDSENKTVVAGADGITEAALFPERNGSPGNFGTVNIGHSENSTSLLSNQILNGVSKADLDYHGGELSLQAGGQLPLGGDTGISAGIEDELAAIRGQARIIPIYRKVTGNGNNAVYTIVRFVGIRILDVRLTGGDKRVVIQPAHVTTSGVIPSEDSNTSDYVASPPWLVK